MEGLFFESDGSSRDVIRFIVMLIGFWTAWRAGRAAAEGWSDYPIVIVYSLLLGVMMRFLHYALFQGPFISPFYYLLDVALLLIFASIGFRMKRTNQMVNNYYWIYERTSAFSWKKKD